MAARRDNLRLASSFLLLALSMGCHHATRQPSPHFAPPTDVPCELSKTTLPPYVIEPPDILVIDAVRVIPKSPYRVNTLDVLGIQATGTFPDSPIAGPYTVEPGGGVNLGLPYGVVKVAGLTLDEVAKALTAHLRLSLREPQVSVTLIELAGKQQVAGQHLVSQDGTVTLGTYGSVYVVGMTLAQAKVAIEAHLSQFLEQPEIAVDVFAYNSRVYYIITEGAGLGDGVARFPVTGNETVLDALAQVNGLTGASSKRIWVARPRPHGQPEAILPVDWCAIAAKGDVTTNYQLFPGDRVFIAEDKLVALDTGLGKILSPVERLFGFTLLGNATVRALQQGKNSSGFGAGGGVGF
jgi:polysaccharide export outer membrane protein